MGLGAPLRPASKVSQKKNGKKNLRRPSSMRIALARRATARRLSTLATVLEKGAAVPITLKANGLADLPITLPIHRRGEMAMAPRAGASMIEVCGHVCSERVPKRLRRRGVVLARR